MNLWPRQTDNDARAVSLFYRSRWDHLSHTHNTHHPLSSSSALPSSNHPSSPISSTSPSRGPPRRMATADPGPRSSTCPSSIGSSSGSRSASRRTGWCWTRRVRPLSSSPATLYEYERVCVCVGVGSGREGGRETPCDTVRAASRLLSCANPVNLGNTAKGCVSRLSSLVSRLSSEALCVSLSI